MQPAVVPAKLYRFGLFVAEGGYKDAEIIVAHLEHKPAADVEKVAAREEADAMKEIDPEEKYVFPPC